LFTPFCKFHHEISGKITKIILRMPVVIFCCVVIFIMMNFELGIRDMKELRIYLFDIGNITSLNSFISFIPNSNKKGETLLFLPFDFLA
jgi:hypothetical protein